MSTQTIEKYSFEYCSLHYLNQWLSKDKGYCNALASNNENEKLSELKKAATFYKIARNLHGNSGEKFRYKPLLEILNKTTQEQFKNDLIGEIRKIENEISKEYGNQGVLSATTKFLWLKIKHPIVIYDSKARKALDSRDGDLEEFYNKWHEEFSKNKEKIENVCSELSKLHLYAVDQRIGTEDYIKQISSETWFHERVFDIYLWHKGAE